MTMLARAFAPKAVKSIDQAAQSVSQGGVYVRLDDRSIITQNFLDAQGSALSMSTVYACVRVLAESVASLPFILYRRLPGGGKERADDHRMWATLHDQPNPSMTSFVWRELLMSHLAAWGNHDSEITIDSFDRVSLWPIRPDRMEYRWAADGTRRFFYQSPTGTRTELDSAAVFHVSGLSSNGLSGLSPISLHSKTLQLSVTAQDFGQNFLANNARPATVLTHPGNLSPDAISRLAGQMDQMRGSRNSGKTVILEEGLTITEVGVPPEDAQYIQTRKFQRQVIATEIFRIPPHMIGDLESGASYASIEQMSLEFVTYVLMPWLARIEQECKAQLLAGEDVFPEFLVDGLLRGDAKSRAESLAIQRQNGVINGDQWNDIENRNHAPDGSGAIYWMPLNYQAAATPESVAADAAARLAKLASPPQLVAVKSAEFRCPDDGQMILRGATPGSFGDCRKCKKSWTVTDDGIKQTEVAA